MNLERDRSPTARDFYSHSRNEDIDPETESSNPWYAVKIMPGSSSPGRDIP